MSKKLFVTLSILLPTLVLGSSQVDPKLIIIESTSLMVTTKAEEIVSNYPGIVKLQTDEEQNLIYKINENQEVINELIFKLRSSLGESVKVEQVSSSDIKKGTQDGEFGK